MMNMKPVAQKVFLEKTIREAGRRVLGDFKKNHTVSYKAAGGRKPVTETDRETDAFFARAVKRHFPDDVYLSEEVAPDTDIAGEYAWIVDPIDGTSNFISGVPLFVVSAARVNPSGEVEVGAVYDPLHNELFLAERGKGATLNGKDLRQIAVANRRPHMVRFGGWNEEEVDRDTLQRISARCGEDKFKVYRFGTAALTLTYLAAGRLDMVALLGELSPWDIAGAYGIAKESGVFMIHPDGSPFRITAPKLFAARADLAQLIV